MDTTSNALSITLLLLSEHPYVQQELRDEILAAHDRSGGGMLDYDTLVALDYLDAVCRETLRLYVVLCLPSSHPLNASENVLHTAQSRPRHPSLPRVRR